MAYEIDVLDIGKANSMIIKWFDADGEEIIILIDAGYRKDGPKIRQHLQNYTRNNKIDLAICTHPDGDHIGGFLDIVGKVKIDEFWIHDPTNHRQEVRNLIDSADSEEIKKSLRYVCESLVQSENLVAKIDRARIPRSEPFSGLGYSLAPLTVVGPSKFYYQRLLSRFRDVGILLRKSLDLKDKFVSLVETVAEERLFSSSEMLDMDDDKSNENNSSAIILFEPTATEKYLFTADAGPDSLRKAMSLYDLSDLYWLSVPHHGSRASLTTDIIETLNPKLAYISADGTDNFPHWCVIEELTKIGCRLYSTHISGNLLHRRNTPRRPGYTKAQELLPPA